MPSLKVDSPIGPLVIVEDNGALVALTIGKASDASDETPLLRDAARQLEEYFAGRRRRFALPLAPRGTPFQRALWRALEAIPYGEVRTYGELAAALDSVPRAVGGACGSNPIPVIIPCHRVVASQSRGGQSHGARSLGGYSGGDGLPTKRRLLALEKVDLVADLFAQP